MATTGSSSDHDNHGLPDHVIEDLLSDEHRRRALSILAARGEPLIVDDLAAAVLAAERDIEPAEVPEADRAALRNELFTEHLPKLTATGIVSYDSMVGTVELQRREALPEERL
ncbi:MAG: hypothetical protein ABEH86_01950 [Haloarcula sp.]